ncbi:MAG: serine hydrolase domain-containing protein [Alphaproteobacteria bacterium]
MHLRARKRLRQRAARIAGAGLLFAFPAAAQLAPAPTPAGDWPRATPEEAGFDASALRRFTADLQAGRLLTGLHCLLIVRRGYLVVEECPGGQRADEVHMLQSVSKSVASALVGIAIERGDFQGTGEKVLAFFPHANIQNLDSHKRALRIEDLLTMRSGTDYHERGPGSPHRRLNRLSEGWDRFYLNRPMEARPGTRFQYDSGAVILMSSMLKQRTGLHADSYADKYLFVPMGITARRWLRNAEGHPHTGGGLSLSARDMAKFGLLYLRGGKWGERQIVPEAWVRESTRAHVRFKERRFHRATGYGYWWWILEPVRRDGAAQRVYGALGHGGQHILVAPAHDLVVVTTAGMNRDMHRAVDVLYTHILPALSPG